MISVTRQRLVAVPHHPVFTFLAEPENLPRVMQRITRIEKEHELEQGWAVNVCFNFGAHFGQRTAPGVFATEAAHTISFRSREPIPILARWTLQPQGPQTHLIALLEFNLKPLLGPLALMAPMPTIKRRIGAELEAALVQVESLLSSAQ